MQEFSNCYSSDSLPDFSAGVGMSEGLKRLACWLGLNNNKNEDGSNPNEIFFPVFFSFVAVWSKTTMKSTVK